MWQESHLFVVLMWFWLFPVETLPLWQSLQFPVTNVWSNAKAVQLLVVWQSEHALLDGGCLTDFPFAMPLSWQSTQVVGVSVKLPLTWQPSQATSVWAPLSGKFVALWLKSINGETDGLVSCENANAVIENISTMQSKAKQADFSATDMKHILIYGIGKYSSESVCSDNVLPDRYRLILCSSLCILN